jgi:hypothetical protein
MGSRPRRPRFQASALLGRFNLAVSKQNRAASFDDLAGPHATEDTIDKPYAGGSRSFSLSAQGALVAGNTKGANNHTPANSKEIGAVRQVLIGA